MVDGLAAHQIFKLSPCLFDNCFLTAYDDTHSAEITNLRSTYDQRIDVETSSSQDT